MKKTFSTIALSLTIATGIVSAPQPAKAVIATVAVQMLQYAQQIIEYVEMIKQTEALIQQTEMEIQNLKQLGTELKEQPLDFLLKMAQKTAELETYRADFNVLAQTFNELWPEETNLADLAGADTEGIDAANAEYQRLYDSWSTEVDKSLKATFQLSGAQLQEMVDNGEMKDYIEQLLMTKDDEGQERTLEAANQLAALQINESQKLRELIATRTQGEVIREAKVEKEKEMSRAMLKEATATDKLKDGPKNDKKF